MNLSDTVDRKFIESLSVTDWEVETEDGWVDVTAFHTTIPYEVYEVILENGSKLDCADTHIIMSSTGRQVFAVDSLGEDIKASSGPSKVVSVTNKHITENMYDLTVNSTDHTYYTNGILSHNTEVSILYLLHYVLFNQDKTVAILANNERTATDILRKLKDSYEGLPLWLQQGICDGGWSKTSIKLENGCLIISSSTSSNAIRGRTISLALLDEFAFVPNNVADDFIASVFPTISSGLNSKIIMVSTPKGMNHFYNIWMKATKGENGFTPIRIHWWEVPGRDEDWKQRTIADIGAVRFSQEFSCVSGDGLINIIDGDGTEHNITLRELYDIAGKKTSTP